MQLALSSEQLQKAQEELDEIYGKNEQLEAALEQLVIKLAEADERDKAAAVRLEEAQQEREALVAKHVADTKERNERLAEVSASVRESLVFPMLFPVFPQTICTVTMYSAASCFLSRWLVACCA